MVNTSFRYFAAAEAAASFGERPWLKKKVAVSQSILPAKLG